MAVRSLSFIKHHLDYKYTNLFISIMVLPLIMLRIKHGFPRANSDISFYNIGMTVSYVLKGPKPDRNYFLSLESS